MVLFLGANATVAVKHMEVWGAQHFESDRSTVAPPGVFDQLHSASSGRFWWNERGLIIVKRVMEAGPARHCYTSDQYASWGEEVYQGYQPVDGKTGLSQTGCHITGYCGSELEYCDLNLCR